jgi:hypothetical protein
MPIYLVPDPTWQGKPPAPLMIRADAMRKMYKEGAAVSVVAQHFEVPYSIAYKAIKPPHKAAGQRGSNIGLPLTKSRLRGMNMSQLARIASKPGVRPGTPDGERAEAAQDELLRRDPKWLEG